MSCSNNLILALQRKISTEEKLPLAYAAILTETALHRFDERVQAGVTQWLDGTLEDSFAIEDISLAEIQHEMGGSLFQALNVMDIYLKNREFIPSALWFMKKDTINVKTLDLSKALTMEDLEDDE